MAHTKFTFTFPTGVAGGRVTFNADTYDDPQVNRPTRGELDLREPRTRDGVTFTDPWIIVYSDASSLTATTSDAAGNPLTATATTGSPVAAGPAAGGGTTPGSQPSAASVVAPDWQPSTAYKAKQLVWQAGQLYRAKAAFTSGASFSATNWDAVGSGASTGAASLTPTATKTAAYTAAVGDFVPVDTTSGNVTVTLPAAPADKSQVEVKHIVRGGTNVVTVACAGSDVFNKSGGSTTLTLTLLNQSAILQYTAATGIWYVTTGDLPLAQLDSRFAAIGSAGLTATVDGTNATSLAITTGVTAADIGAAYASIAWQANTPYKANQLVYQSGSFYYANADFTSGASFNGANWTQVVLSSPVYEPAPSDFSWLTWSGVPKDSGGTALFSAAGVGQIVRLKLPVSGVVTNIVVSVASAGNTLTNSFAALYDSTGAQLGVTADQSTVWNSAGFKTMALTTPTASLAAGSVVFALFVCGSATTLPTFNKASGSGSSTMVNGGKSGANIWYGTYSSGMTAAPASITLTSMAAGANTYWVALS